MGGNSSSESTSKVQPRATSLNNPYYTTTTDANGNTSTTFKQGTAGETSYNFVNQNIAGLLDQYMRPNLNSATNQAKLNAFNKTQQSNLQNNIVNPLVKNNLLRSSQATNMYNNLSNQSADFTNDLIANNQNDTWNMINNLVSLYSLGYQGIGNEQSQSINASLGAGETTSSSKGKA